MHGRDCAGEQGQQITYFKHTYRDDFACMIYPKDLRSVLAWTAVPATFHEECTNKQKLSNLSTLYAYCAGVGTATVGQLQAGSLSKVLQ